MSPFDLLTLSAEKQLIIRCLIREPQLTATEIASRLGHPLVLIQGFLDQLVADNKVTNNKQLYSITSKRVVHSRRSVGLLDSLYG